MLEDEENIIFALKKEIQEGLDSGIAKCFNSKKNIFNL
ncbi:MAG: hypothetical protein U0X41_10130 [Chitinophagales bacterium]